MYYRGAAAAIVVYDITEQESFDGAQTWVQEIQIRGEPDAVIALVGINLSREIDHTFYHVKTGNKCDEEENRTVAKADAESFAIKNGLIHMETSAKTGINVSNLFEEIG
jgi:Ras-related protein Rab-5C